MDALHSGETVPESHRVPLCAPIRRPSRATVPERRERPQDADVRPL